MRPLLSIARARLLFGVRTELQLVAKHKLKSFKGVSTELSNRIVLSARTPWLTGDCQQQDTRGLSLSHSCQHLALTLEGR